jgi:phosphatidylserine/phosphatidylglycerophosphate/cardiolipin synthase-like enzyme
MTVKTLFFTPLSVMHPKYLIVDDATAWVPSCNVSWERWFEGCIELNGGAVQTLLTFHERVWGLGSRGAISNGPDGQNATGKSDDTGSGGDQTNASLTETANNDMSATQSIRISAAEPVPTVLLPSSHHRNPAFRWLRFFGTSKPPMTPLNAALLALFGNAKRKITLVTPNFTAKPVINALLAALSRGVSVEIRTNGGMMVLEQLVTAGTTTNWSIKRLIKRYNKLAQEMHAHAATDVEAQAQEAGTLDIFYYRPLARRADKEDEPVVSHFKMTMVDDEYLVLGSGNMDRASWWTSQELGILFYMPGFEEHALWERAFEARAQRIFP